MCCVSAISPSPLLSLAVCSVSCSICGLRQVSSQPGGGGDILGTDRPVGQPQSPPDPRPEDSSVSSCTHCKASSTSTSTVTVPHNKLSRDLTEQHSTAVSLTMTKSFRKVFDACLSFEVQVAFITEMI